MLKYVLNPFSKKAKEIVKSAPPVQELPDEVFALARKKIAGEADSRDAKSDVLSFYLLLNATALKFGANSNEARALKERIKNILQERIRRELEKYYDAKIGYEPRAVKSVFSEAFEVIPLSELEFAKEVPAQELRIASASTDKEYAIAYAVEWKSLLPAMRNRSTSLTEQYIVKGYALLSAKNLMELFGEVVLSEAEEYLARVSAGTKKKELALDPRLEEIAESVAKLPSQPLYLQKTEGSGQRALKFDLFPPCITQTLAGVSSGSRNYAITVLLTAFLSYARLAPIGAQKNAKISDYTSDIKIVTEEIIPLIYSAAERCSPPLFADQPLEKMNVIYHLGFGLTSEPRIEDAGKSSWYFVPNCEKVRRESPSLCTPDKDCKEVKNPLNYYAKKLFAKKGRTKEKASAGK